ncbi:hypothetical protein OROGR_014239 [Orobanche gracilis]
MVCSIGSGKMTALSRLLDAGSVSQDIKAKEEIGHQKLAAHYIKREIQEADEANLLDEDDMHIFGLRPMTDPLDLEFCRTLSSKEVLYPELDRPIVNKKPPRKERKKSTQTQKATLVRDLRKFESMDSDNIAASESHVAEKIQIYPSAEAQRDLHLTTTHIMNGSVVNPYDMHCSEDATKGSSISLKRTATENPSNPCTKNLCKTAAEDVPSPIATKIYYSQRNYLRRAISDMFFEESSSDVSNLEVLQVNEVPIQTSSPSNFYHEQVANHRTAQRDDSYSHLARTPDQILAARADCYIGKPGGLVPTMNTVSHYSSKSYSFAGKSEKTSRYPSAGQ